jgi:hypothetical protein
MLVPPPGDSRNDRSKVKVLLFLNAPQEARIPTDFPCLGIFDPVGQVTVRHGRSSQSIVLFHLSRESLFEPNTEYLRADNRNVS